MGGAMRMVMQMVMPLMNMMKESSSVYMTDEADDCAAPPEDNDEMMTCDEAMKIACQDVSHLQRPICWWTWVGLTWMLSVPLSVQFCLG